jgi:tetratricopeptide (TPR) repeat protein
MRKIVLIILILLNLSSFAQVSSKTKMRCKTRNKEARKYYNSGTFGMDNHLLKQSRILFMNAVKIDPNFCDAWDNLSICCRRMGLYDEAFNAGMHSALIDSTNPISWMNCGYASYLNNDIYKALTSFDYLQHFDPNNPEGFYGKSMVLYSIDSISEARINIYKAEQCYMASGIKKGPEVDLMKGFIEFKSGNIKEAQKIFEKIYSKFEENADLNYFLGICVLENDNNLNNSKYYINRAKLLGYNIEGEPIKMK